MELSNKRIRSRVDELKMRMSRLDQIIENLFKFVNLIKRGNLNELIYDYIKWCQTTLISMNLDLKNDVEIVVIKNEIMIFEQKLKSQLMRYRLYLNWDQGSFLNPKLQKIIHHQMYGNFLERGTLIYLNVIDPYGLWFDKLKIPNLMDRKQAELITYVYLAMLARFTLPRKNGFYKSIYGSNLRNIKLSVPKAFENPSYNNVVALGMLCYLHLSHFNFVAIKKYFTAAIRMAQCLGYDKQDDVIMDQVDKKHFDLIRGRKLWKTLYLTYIVLQSSIPDLPYVKFNVHDTSSHLLLKKNNQNSNHVFLGLPGDFMKQLAEVALKIFSHIQNIKKEYNVECFKDIPNDQLKLPPICFNQSLTDMLNLTSHPIIINLNPTNEYESNLKKTIEIMVQIGFIGLYYPVLSIYPQPVKFSDSEIQFLYQCSNKITERFINNDALIGSKHDEPLIKIQSTQFGNHVKANYKLLYFKQLCYPVFVYFNILHHNNKDKDIIDNCTKNSIAIINQIAHIYQISIGNKKKDSKLALECIKEAIGRFHLPEELNTIIRQSLNQL